MSDVPYLIDGNNLTHALKAAGLDVGRGGLCSLLGALAEKRVTVVFDGPGRGGVSPQPPDGVDVCFSGSRSADELIAERIAADSAPRRLIVVSTDRAIRRAARRRRCKSLRSDEFAGMLIRLAETPPARPNPEPPQKRRGLGPGEADEWLEEFGLDRPDGDRRA